jgi:hypothetical protein
VFPGVVLAEHDVERVLVQREEFAAAVTYLRLVIPAVVPVSAGSGEPGTPSRYGRGWLA